VTGRGFVKHLADGETLDLPGWSMTMGVTGELPGPELTAGLMARHRTTLAADLED
jgi:hypothetical protein